MSRCTILLEDKWSSTTFTTESTKNILIQQPIAQLTVTKNKNNRDTRKSVSVAACLLSSIGQLSSLPASSAALALLVIHCHLPNPILWIKKGSKGCPYSIAERGVPELIPVLGSQPAGDVSHKPGGRLPLLSAKPAVTAATLKRAATNFAAW